MKRRFTLGNVRDVIRKHNVSEQSFYRWRRKYGGPEMSDVHRLKDLERETWRKSGAATQTPQL